MGTAWRDMSIGAQKERDSIMRTRTKKFDNSGTLGKLSVHINNAERAIARAAEVIAVDDSAFAGAMRPKLIAAIQAIEAAGDVLDSALKKNQAIHERDAANAVARAKRRKR